MGILDAAKKAKAKVDKTVDDYVGAAKELVSFPGKMISSGGPGGVAMDVAMKTMSDEDKKRAAAAKRR